jgi:hypothetical protein
MLASRSFRSEIVWTLGETESEWPRRNERIPNVSTFNVITIRT